jgi:hypothetical protein
MTGPTPHILLNSRRKATLCGADDAPTTAAHTRQARRCRSWWPEALARLQAGEKPPAIATALGVGPGAVQRLRTKMLPELAQAAQKPPPLNEEELAALRRWHGLGMSCQRIARKLGRGPATVSRHARRLGLAWSRRPVGRAA